MAQLISELGPSIAEMHTVIPTTDQRLDAKKNFITDLYCRAFVGGIVCGDLTLKKSFTLEQCMVEVKKANEHAWKSQFTSDDQKHKFQYNMLCYLRETYATKPDDLAANAGSGASSVSKINIDES